MTSRPDRFTGPLELRPAPSGPAYHLGPEPLFTGDPLEVETSSGWVGGTFHWSLQPDEPPLLLLSPTEHGRPSLGELKLNAGQRCRKA